MADTFRVKIPETKVLLVDSSVDGVYTWGMKLHVPKEPKDILARMKSVREQMGDSTIDWDSFSVWHGNQLPQYLWNEWKDELKTRGFNWQKFLKLLRMRTDTILGWFKGIRKWEETAKDIIDLLESPLGEDMAKK